MCCSKQGKKAILARLAADGDDGAKTDNTRVTSREVGRIERNVLISMCGVYTEFVGELPIKDL